MNWQGENLLSRFFCFRKMIFSELTVVRHKVYRCMIIYGGTYAPLLQLAHELVSHIRTGVLKPNSIKIPAMFIISRFMGQV